MGGTVGVEIKSISFIERAEEGEKKKIIFN